MKIKPIIAILSTLGCVVTTPAFATLTVSGTGTAGSSYTFGPTTDQSYVSDSGYVSNGIGSSASSSAWGNAYGTYRASAYGDGVFDSQGKFSRALTIENNTGFTTQYSLNVFIYYGGLSIYNYAGVSGDGWTSYDLDITKNGSISLFDSYAKLNQAGALTQSGTALNGAALSSGTGYSSYSWNGTNLMLDLGSLGAGQSMTINFDLVSTAHGNFGVNSRDCGGYGEYGAYGGDGNEALVSDGYGGYGGTCYDTGTVYGSLGDPSDPFGNTQGGGFMNITGTAVNQVPLPATLSLVGLGLLGLGAFRRKAFRT